VAASLRGRAATGVAWTTVDAVGSRLITTVVFVALARLLDPASFGLVALALVFISLMRLLVDQGFGSAIVQRSELSKGHLDTAFWVTLASGAALAGLLCALAGPIATVTGSRGLAPVLQALSLVIVVGAPSSIAVAVLRRDLAFHRLAVRKLVAALCGGVAGIVGALAGLGVWSLVLQALVLAAVSTVLLWTVTSYRPSFHFSRGYFGELFGFSSKVIGITTVNFLSRRSDDLLVGSVLGAVSLGLYSVAYRLLTIMTETLSTTIDLVAYPTFSKLQDDRQRLRRAYASAVRTSAAVAAPAFLGAALLAPELIEVLFGDKWAASIPVMRVLALAGLAHSLISAGTPLLLAVGRPQDALKVNATIAAANVVGFAIAVQFGILAVAAVFTIRAYLLAPLSIWSVKRVLGFTWWEWLRPVLPAVGSALAMALVLAAGRTVVLPELGPLGWLLVATPSGALLYLAAMRVLAPHQLREFRADVASVVLRRRAKSA